ncbi:hypothetical protein JTE90_013530 [Oedothorax gibbosus]|uniref:Uncharacterized protein n=1 Tax=Oedothorax gibbosus TaxID=931172 RepID=A0AAV6U7G3_9ARAC|nr:hypothetical protein JTE90_013530 [Oedothorax gibbosus]
MYKFVECSVANSLSKAGLLDCNSAIPLALEYFDYIQKETEGLDRTQFETYVQGVTFGWRDLLVAHHLDLGALTADAAESGLLDCDSAIPLALEYFGYIQDETGGLGRKQFETYVQDVTFGWRDLLVGDHLDLGALTL